MGLRPPTGDEHPKIEVEVQKCFQPETSDQLNRKVFLFDAFFVLRFDHWYCSKLKANLAMDSP